MTAERTLCVFPSSQDERAPRPHRFAGWKAVLCAVVVLSGGVAAGKVWAIAQADPAFVSSSIAYFLPASVQAPRAAEAAPKAEAPPAPAVETAEAVPTTLPALKLLPPPPVTLVLNADLGAQRLAVIENGVTKHTWKISSGREGYATKTGTFRPQWASRMWYSRQYDDAPMPHAIFFHKGMAFHATTAVRKLGQRASHGCIRLAPSNAETLFKLVHRHGYARTKIIVHNGAKSDEPTASVKSPRKRAAGAPRSAPRG
jgi:lipoprotein-anchoring transpeptidase ErfK/SrfK